nr:hypothetical protein [Tanacetum cinerariifolium]
MEGNDDAAGSGKKKLKNKLKFIGSEKPTEEKKKQKKKKHTSPFMGKHVRINEMFKKKKTDDEAKIIEKEEVAAKAREDEDAEDNEDADATANENTNEEAVKAKAKADEIAIRRAKLLAELEAINKEAEEHEKEKKTKKHRKLASPFKDNEANAENDTEKDANESDDATTKATVNGSSSTKRSNFVVRLKAYSKKLTEAEKQKNVEETKDDGVNEDETDNEEDAKENKTDNEEDDNENKTGIEENAKETDDVDQVFSMIKTMPFLNNPKRTKKKEYGKYKKDGKKTNKTQSSTLKEYLKKQSNNESGEEEQDKSDEKEDTKKLKMVKMEKESKHGKEYPTCNTRSSPKALYDVMMSLSAARKKCLKEIGFERFIHFPIVELPSTLAYHVIENFHSPSMELRQQREWDEQFRHLKKPTPPAIAAQISSTEDADFMFKMNFITLFGSTMGTLENGGRVPTKLIKSITEDVDISDIDRCGITMEKKQRCLGNLEHHGDFDPGEQQHGLDLYKVLDVYIVLLSERKPVTKEIMTATTVMKMDPQCQMETRKIKNENENEKQSGNENEKESIKDMGKETKEGGSEETNDKEKDEDEVINKNEYEKLNEKIRENAVLRSVNIQNEEMKEKENNEEKSVIKTNTFLAIEDEPISPKIDDSFYDLERDILLLEEFLNDDPSSPPLPLQELKVVCGSFDLNISLSLNEYKGLATVDKSQTTKRETLFED